MEGNVRGPPVVHQIPEKAAVAVAVKNNIRHRLADLALKSVPYAPQPTTFRI